MYTVNVFETIYRLTAQKIDGVDLRGYTAGSLMDNFYWNRGYETKFGLFQVDFNDDSRPRTPKRSSVFYKSVYFYLQEVDFLLVIY